MQGKQGKYLSTSSLARLLHLQRDELFDRLEEKGWLNDRRTIAEKGLSYGAKYESNEKGAKWPVWPENIIENKLFKSEVSGEVALVKRKFKLPGVDDLNKDQDRVLRLPEDGQYLIVGGPGTGKSVVALLRAMKYHEGNDYAFLTFNKVLLSATKQLVGFNLNSFTLDSWLRREYCKAITEYCEDFEYFTPPELNYNTRDYDVVISKLEKEEIVPRTMKIIIDEGQDKPPKYYEALMYLGFENFFIVADQNQQITSDHSSRQELTDLLGLETDDVIELKENYRNSHPIALFCNTFYTDPSSPPPNLPKQSKSGLGIPTLYDYSDFQECAKFILREYDRDNRNLIGVVVANDEMRDTYFKVLDLMDLNLDNPRPTISTYSSKDKKAPNINFAYSGIVVLNDRSIKGLEFDMVFIVVDGFTIYNNDIDSMKKRFYVMSSRAIKKLVLFKHDNYSGGVEKILTEDENILKRGRLDNG